MMTLYDVLGVSSSASQAEIKAAWRNLVLKHHPDKTGTPSTPSERTKAEVDIHLLTSAYEVLRSDLKREIYDRELRESAQTNPTPSLYTTPTAPPPLARTTFSLSDFTPHHGPRPSVVPSAHRPPSTTSSREEKEDASDEDQDPTYYTHPCRCGFELLISREDLEEGVDVIGCDGCGDWIGVGYEVLEEESEEEEDAAP